MKALACSYRKYLPLALASLALAIVLFACVIPGFQAVPSVNSNPGSLLPEPSVGLGDLQSYQAVYDLTLHGAIDGESFDRQSHIEYSFVTHSQDEEVIWQDQQTGSSEVFQHILRMGSTVYTRSQDGQDCWGEYNDQPAEIVPQPTSLLLPVTKASRVGAETVNGVATQHYHFGQDGLPLEGQGASGKAWIAQQGGYVVKYTLSIPGPTKPTGKGDEIAETLSYELKKINSFDQITLPAGCVPVLVDFPAMADAQNIYRGSGYMDYTSPSAVAQAVDFYNQALPPLGWVPVGPSVTPAQSDSQALEYTKGDQRLTIFLNKTADSLEVTVGLYNPALAPQEPTETPGPSPTPEPQPTINASQSGLPADVPLYPGATDLKKLPNFGVSFSTSDAPDVVAKFYRDQLKTFKWNLQNEMKPAVDTVIQTWMMSNRMLVVNIGVKNGTTTVMLMLSGQP